MTAFLCWECKTCGWEHWAPEGTKPPSSCPDPNCGKENATWIGHRAGARSSCSAQALDDELAALEAGAAVDVLDSTGRWVAARFVGWVADGLGAAIDGVDTLGQRLRSCGRFAIRVRRTGDG